MKEHASYRGVIVPMVSPFTADGTIDVSAVRRLVDHLLAGGVHGIFALGTTGEAASIPARERERLVDAVVQAVNGRAMVYAGISSNCFADSVAAARAYHAMGADAAVAHPPCYYPLSDSEIRDYFLALADAIDLPLVLYNIPVTTHQSISLDVLDELRRHERIVALKESANDAPRLSQLLPRMGSRGGFPVLLGCSAQFAHGLKLGGVGLVPSGGHLAATLYCRMFDAAMSDAWDEVQELQKQTETICASYLAGRSLPQQLATLKLLLERQGLCSRHVLPPLRPASDDEAPE